MTAIHPTPSKEQITQLPEFARLRMESIVLVDTAALALQAKVELMRCKHWGFDTESKPTFVKDQLSDGPHVVQLATLEKAWVFQLQDPACCAAVAELLAMPAHTKAGFGLGDDRKRIRAKLAVEPVNVLELNTVFRQRGYRQDMGIKGAIAVLFGQRFLKSKKAATSNWACPTLTPSQLAYAANDAYGAIRVFHALGLT